MAHLLAAFKLVNAKVALETANLTNIVFREGLSLDDHLFFSKPQKDTSGQFLVFAKNVKQR